MFTSKTKLIPGILLSLSFFLFAGCGAGNVSHEEEGHGHNHEEKSGHEDEASLTQERMDAVGIRIGVMEKREMSDIISASGTIEVPPQAVAVATPSLGGIVSRIAVTEGQTVAKGQTVAIIDAPEIISLREAYKTSLQDVETATREYDRQQALSRQGAGIRRNLEAALSALTNARTTLQGCSERLSAYGVSPEGTGGSFSVKAPVSGIVVSVDAETGSFADPQRPVARIVDNNSAYCLIYLPEKDISKIKSGMPVEMRLTNDPEIAFSGKVTEINPVIDAVTKAVPIRVSISAEKSGLIPGMSVTAAVSLGGNMTEVLPEGAVVSTGGRSYIFVLEDEEGHEGEFHFKKTEVSTGVASMGFVAVTPLQSLPTDTKVVVAGAFYINSMISDHGEHDH